jgi:gamma-glutamylputrescine oxidase
MIPNTSAWWHDLDTPLRPALTHDIEADVCVVGLGGSGLSAVREARALGARVIGVDAGRIAWCGRRPQRRPAARWHGRVSP